MKKTKNDCWVYEIAAQGELTPNSGCVSPIELHRTENWKTTINHSKQTNHLHYIQTIISFTCKFTC